MQEQKTTCIEQASEISVEIGDLDLNRNLKIRPYVGLVLTPVFRDLQPRLKYAEMGRSGVAAMQYYAEFGNHPARFGYGDRFTGHYSVALRHSVSEEIRGPERELQRVERFILETRATVTGHLATGVPASLGFEPSLGNTATAGTGRVFHVLTRPGNPPGQRWVHEIPEEIAFLEPAPLEGAFPTIPALTLLDDGFEDVQAGRSRQTGIWGISNSDVYQHINAREYLAGMENGITLCLAAAQLPLERYVTTRAQVIFRRPSFIGHAYVVSVRLYRRGDEIVALGSYHGVDEDGAGNDAKAAVFMRFEGRLA